MWKKHIQSGHFRVVHILGYFLIHLLAVKLSGCNSLSLPYLSLLASSILSSTFYLSLGWKVRGKVINSISKDCINHRFDQSIICGFSDVLFDQNKMCLWSSLTTIILLSSTPLSDNNHSLFFYTSVWIEHRHHTMSHPRQTASEEEYAISSLTLSLHFLSLEGLSVHELIALRKKCKLEEQQLEQAVREQSQSMLIHYHSGTVTLLFICVPFSLSRLQPAWPLQ